MVSYRDGGGVGQRGGVFGDGCGIGQRSGVLGDDRRRVDSGLVLVRGGDRGVLKQANVISHDRSVMFAWNVFPASSFASSLASQSNPWECFR